MGEKESGRARRGASGHWPASRLASGAERCRGRRDTHQRKACGDGPRCPAGARGGGRGKRGGSSRRLRASSAQRKGFSRRSRDDPRTRAQTRGFPPWPWASARLGSGPRPGSRSGLRPPRVRRCSNSCRVAWRCARDFDARRRVFRNRTGTRFGGRRVGRNAWRRRWLQPSADSSAGGRDGGASDAVQGPPKDPAAVNPAITRVFFDDFESATIDKWHSSSARCTPTTVARDGTSPHAGQSMAECNWNGRVPGRNVELSEIYLDVARARVEISTAATWACSRTPHALRRCRGGWSRGRTPRSSSS